MITRQALGRRVSGFLSIGAVWNQSLYTKQTAHTEENRRPAMSSPVARSPSIATSGDRDSQPWHEGSRRGPSQLIFIGSGSSSGVPSPFRLLHPELQGERVGVDKLAVSTPPERNKNYRGNTSVVIRIVRGSYVDGVEVEPEVKHIQIDTGKTWREGVIRWYPRHGIRDLNSIILTHDHADAMLGLDDVRGVQDHRSGIPLPVYLSERTESAVKRVFPYLMGQADDNLAGGRFVSSLSFHIIEEFQPFKVEGLEVTPFPVMHGEDYVSLGFLFGEEGNKTCYISDVSRVPNETMDFLLKHGQIDLLVCDALTRGSRVHPTHFSVDDAVQLAVKLNARRTLLVGLSSDIEYEETNSMLESRQREGAPNVRLAHDGLVVDVAL